MREPPPLQQVDRTKVLFNNRKLLYFSGCDYFRMASHPEVLSAVQKAVSTFGLNVAASRITTGNHALYLECEEALAQFFKAPTATLVNSGYLTNLVVAQVLAGEFSHVLVDAGAHVALKDAAPMFESPVIEFQHRNPADLARKMKPLGRAARPILLTDGLFSHDGSTAPLKEYLTVLPRNAMILVDDAHGGGVVGENGRGTPEEQGVSRSRIIQTITLSKAFGTHGGAILGPTGLRNGIFQKSRIFAGTTPPPLPIAAAALVSLRLLRTDRSFLARLRKNSEMLKLRIAPDLLANPGPIVPVMPGANATVPRVTQALLKHGIYPPLIRYCNGPSCGYFRFVISSEHRLADLQKLISALADAKLT